MEPKRIALLYMLFGNFISNQQDAHTHTNAILNIQVTKNGVTGEMSIDSVDYVPVYVWNKGAGVKNRYELLDIKEEMAAYESGDTSKINATLYNTLKKELADIVKVLGNPISREEFEKQFIQEESNVIVRRIENLIFL